MTNFLPSDYTPPESKSNYLKLEEGDHKFRFLVSPIIGWVYWTDKKPVRVKTKKELEKIGDLAADAKHFWAATVWNYATKSIQILEITQKTIQGSILDLNNDPSWGDPKEYDLTIKRKGKGLSDTEYTVIPAPKTLVDPEILKQAKKVKLEALYDSGDPFANLN